VAPVLLCDGLRLFDPSGLDLAGDEGIDLTPMRIVDTQEITHLRHRVEGRARPVLDDRGRGDTAEAEEERAG
jgi:hypothetical protein